MSLKDLEAATEEMVAFVRREQMALGEGGREVLGELVREERSLASLMSDTEAMLALVRREQLALGESEMGALRDFHQRLRGQSGKSASDAEDLELYGLLERHANLRTIYFAIVYLEMAEACAERLKSFSKLARGRGLSEEEGQRMREVEAAQERARNTMRAQLAPLRPA